MFLLWFVVPLVQIFNFQFGGCQRGHCAFDLSLQNAMRQHELQCLSVNIQIAERG